MRPDNCIQKPALTTEAMLLEWLYDDSYIAIRAAATAAGIAEHDLLALGRHLADDAVRLARGEISKISVPHRWPKPGEHGNYQPISTNPPQARL